MIDINSIEDIKKMRIVCSFAAELLIEVEKIIKPGITTGQIDDFVSEMTLARGARSAPLNYRGSDGRMPPYPKSCCTSVNDVACHGIPGDFVIKDGDIINVDVTPIIDGYHGDTSATFMVGNASADALRVTEVARISLQRGIEQVKHGARIGDIGAAIQEHVEANGCNVVKEYVGHGVGRKFHADPHVYHHGKRGTGQRLYSGMIFTIEPMVNIGSSEVYICEDEWTVKTLDNSLSAQFEHTVLVTDDGCEILTLTQNKLCVFD